jgi:hypothetical protein
MMGKSHLLAGSALVFLAAASPAMAEQQTLEDRVRALEQMLGTPPRANDTRTLEQRVMDLEAEIRAQKQPGTAAAPAAQLPVAPAIVARIDQNGSAIQVQDKRLSVVEQKISDTTISGRMYWDVSNVSQKSDGVSQPKNGVGFDAKRFYITVDHRFNSIFSADVTTDFNYVSADGETQLFIKKAYLQATLDPALIIRAGSADVPWIPFVEGLYGYRYLENVLEERASFGSSADWGLHALGSFAGGLISYQVSAIGGAGYKKLVRSKVPTIEGRVNVNYQGFTVALGDVYGTLGQEIEGGPDVQHTGNRFDVLASYTGHGARVGVQYMNASNWNTITNPSSDSSDGVSVWGSYSFTPQWAVFGRYDWVKPSRDLHPSLRDQYFNLGITYSPTRIVDFSLAYKHETVDNGFWATTNGTIGGLVNAPGHSGTYEEIGIFSDFQW